MSKLHIFVFCLLSSCLSSEASLRPRAMPLSVPIEPAFEWEAEPANTDGFCDSLMHFDITDTQLSVVFGYSAAEPEHVIGEGAIEAVGHFAVARPSVGFSLSF
jgi:hypothetical protein